MIYLSSPYSHPDAAVRQARFEAACRQAAGMLRAGHVVFSPIVHSHPLAQLGLPTSWEFWRRIDGAYLARCSALWILTLEGWRESVGVNDEILMARAMRLPVAYVPLGRFDVDM